MNKTTIFIVVILALLSLSFAHGSSGHNSKCHVGRRQRAINIMKRDVKQAFNDIPKGLVATYFIKSMSDGNYVRAITNVPDENGKPAFGTILTNTTIKADLDAGRSFSGDVVLFGRSYFALYEPWVKKGKVIGAFFSGIPLKKC